MQAAPGWYPDPRGGDGHRYWTGEAWAPDPGPDQPTMPMPLPLMQPQQPTYGTGGWERPDAARVPFASPAAGGYDQLSSDYRPGSPAQPGGLRRFAAWLALTAGLLVGFGAGFSVADSRSRDKPAAIATPSPSPTTRPQDSTPAPSRSSAPSESAPDASSSGGDNAAPPPSLGPADPDAAQLDRPGLRPTDVEPTVIVQLIPHGDEVAGTTTLDLCDATYPSEFRRTARRQLVAIDNKDAVVMSTEAVLYSSAAATVDAFAELTKNSAKCQATTGFDKAWPATSGVERLAFDVTSTGTGSVVRSTIVYLRKGRALLALYFRHPGVEANPVAGQRTIAGAAGVFAKRLAAMQSSGATT